MLCACLHVQCTLRIRVCMCLCAYKYMYMYVYLHTLELEVFMCEHVCIIHVLCPIYVRYNNNLSGLGGYRRVLSVSISTGLHG